MSVKLAPGGPNSRLGRYSASYRLSLGRCDMRVPSGHSCGLEVTGWRLGYAGNSWAGWRAFWNFPTKLDVPSVMVLSSHSFRRLLAW